MAQQLDIYAIYDNLYDELSHAREAAKKCVVLSLAFQFQKWEVYKKWERGTFTPFKSIKQIKGIKWKSENQEKFLTPLIEIKKKAKKGKLPKLKWAENKDMEAFCMFEDFAIMSRCAENTNYLRAMAVVDFYKERKDSGQEYLDKYHLEIRQTYKKFIPNNSEQTINISGRERQRVIDVYNTSMPNRGRAPHEPTGLKPEPKPEPKTGPHPGDDDSVDDIENMEEEDDDILAEIFAQTKKQGEQFDSFAMLLNDENDDDESKKNNIKKLIHNVESDTTTGNQEVQQATKNSIDLRGRKVRGRKGHKMPGGKQKELGANKICWA